MLQINKSRLVSEQAPPVSEFVSFAELYAAVIGFVRRQFSVIAFVLLFTLALGAVYLFTAPPRYTGHAVIVIDAHKTQFSQALAPFGDMPIDTQTVDTQIEILTSESVGLSVIKDLHLTEDPEFVSPSAGFVGTIVGFLTFALIPVMPSFKSTDDDSVAPDFRRQRTALATLEGHLTVKRVGLTYAIQIDFQSLSPDRAAKIANAVADAYVVDALEAKSRTTRRAGDLASSRRPRRRRRPAFAIFAARSGLRDWKSSDSNGVGEPDTIDAREWPSSVASAVQKRRKSGATLSSSVDLNDGMSWYQRQT